MLREGIEAVLIVGIIAKYLQQTSCSALMPALWVGVLLASALSLFAGGLVTATQLLAAEFPQKQQELLEGGVNPYCCRNADRHGVLEEAPSRAFDQGHSLSPMPDRSLHTKAHSHCTYRMSFR